MSITAYRLVRESTIPAFAVDEHNRVVTWGKPAADALGLPAQGLVGKSASDLLELRDAFGNRLCRDHCGLHDMARRGEAIEGYTITATKPDGETAQFYASVTVVKGARPETYQIVFFLQPERRRQTVDAILERLLFRRLLVERPQGAVAGTERAAPAGADRISVQLTARQTQILKLIAAGNTTAQIAASLGVSVNTVRHHMQTILEKLECHSQAEAVAKGIRYALI